MNIVRIEILGGEIGEETFGEETFGRQTFGRQTFGWQTFGQINVLLTYKIVISSINVWLTQCLDDTDMTLSFHRYKFGQINV